MGISGGPRRLRRGGSTILLEVPGRPARGAHPWWREEQRDFFPLILTTGSRAHEDECRIKPRPGVVVGNWADHLAHSVEP